MNTHMPFRRFSLGLVEPRALVVGLDAGGEVGVEQRGRMTPGACPSTRRWPAAAIRREHLGIAGDHAGEVHDLGDADARRGPRAARATSLGVERRARRSRTATRARSSTRSTPKVNGTSRAAARAPRRRGRRTRWRSRAGRRRRRSCRAGRTVTDELVDPELRRLEVHVRVDERGRERGAADVDRLVPRRGRPSRRRRRRRSRAPCRPTRGSRG